MATAGTRASAQELETEVEEIAKYDPEMRFRRLRGITLRLVYAMTLVLSIFHIYTAGFGVLQEWRHRAFHLAFVLPLVFFLYPIRKARWTGTKALVADLLYALTGSLILTAIFRELLNLTPAGAVPLAGLSFALLLFIKRREFIQSPLAAYLDLLLFTGALVGVAAAGVLGFRHLSVETWFKDLNPSLVFWGAFLLGTLLAIAALLLSQWIRSVTAILTGRPVRYDQDNLPYHDAFMAMLAAVISVYIFLEFYGLGIRAGLPSRADLLVGGVAVLLVLEGARRSIGAPLPIIAILVLVNSYLGPYFLGLPGLSLFAHRGYSVSRIIDYMYLGTEGIYGIPLGVVATFVFHFVLFGLFIARTGLGQLFIDLAMALAGGTAGGPAKVAVISSGFFGSISGSSVANTVTTGSFTIPLMRRVGYSPVFAGAVEASASTGGQIMPPVMGAAAFIMAEFLGVPYIKIATAAIVPALFYFFAVGMMVHLEALKNGLLGLSRDMLPRAGAVLRERGLIAAPLLIIVYLLISGRSPFLAAFWGIVFSVAIGQIHPRTLPLLTAVLLSAPPVLFDVNPLVSHPAVTGAWLLVGIATLAYAFPRTDRMSWLVGVLPSALLAGLLATGMEPSLAAFWANMTTIAVGVFYPESKMRVADILDALHWGTKNALAIGAACACVGFIVGATTLTGLGLKFAATVVGLAKGAAGLVQSVDVLSLIRVDASTLFFSLLFTAMACFVLGMGIPTTAQYIITSMIAAPALNLWGIHPFVAHMFVFYYAILADVTPPVALAAYAASGISGADPFRTGLRAFTLSSGGFIVPFVFVTAPIVLWYPRILDGKTPFDFLWFGQVLLTMFLGVVALSSTVIGYLKDRSRGWERVATGLAAAFLIFPETISDVVGFGSLATVYLVQRARAKRRQAAGTDRE